MNKRKRKIIYSNKEHTKKGIFSTVLAGLSFVFLILMIVVSYLRKGEIGGSFGATAVLCTVFSAVGIILGAMGKSEPEKFYLFSYLGIGWNIVDLLIVSSILYAGI